MKKLFRASQSAFTIFPNEVKWQNEFLDLMDY